MKLFHVMRINLTLKFGRVKRLQKSYIEQAFVILQIVIYFINHCGKVLYDIRNFRFNILCKKMSIVNNQTMYLIKLLQNNKYMDGVRYKKHIKI